MAPAVAFARGCAHRGRFMPPFTVIHTADWHLGVRLHDLDRSAEHAAFLEWLTRQVQTERASLLVIAGDVFDSANPPQSALRMWYDFLATLRRECPDCQVVATAGNHDSPHVLEAARAPLSGMGVFICGEMPDEAHDCLRVYPDSSGAPALVVAAVPFLRDRDLRTPDGELSAAAVQEQLREGIRRRYAAVARAAEDWKAQGCAALCMGHLTVAGSEVSDSERDIHIGNLGATGSDVFSPSFDYVALGHLHRPQRAGADHIRYSGSPIPLSFSEWRDAKEVRLLTFEGGRLTGSRGLPVPCARPLLRLTTSAECLEASVASLALPDSPHPAWLEVTVDATSEPAALLAERIQNALAGRPAAAVAIRRAAAAAPAAAEEAAPALHDLTPPEVFDALLASAALPEDETEELRLVFRQLLDRHHESSAIAP